MKNSDLKRLYGKDNMQNENGFARLNDKGLIDTPIDSSSIVPPEGTAAGKVMASDGAGKTTWIDNGTDVVANPTLSGTEPALSGLQVGDDKFAVPTPTEVIANPTTTGTEEDLTALQVGDDKYLIPAGTEVIANPTMVGTEEDLTGLQVGDTKYKVGGGGGKLYRHTIRFGQSGLGGAGFCCTTLYSKSSTAFTDSTLKALIGSGRIMAAGFVVRNVNGVFNFYSTRLIEVVSNSLKAVGVEGYLTYTDDKISATLHDMSSNITIFDDDVSEVN